MKKRIKSTISLLLALLMCASSLGAVASFAEDTEADNTPALSWKGYEGDARPTYKEYESSYWYVEDDSADGGASVITLDTDIGFNDGAYNDPTETVAPNIGGMGGHFTLNKGSLSYNPGVLIGFKLVDDDYGIASVDATEMGGVTVTYTSDVPVSLQLDMGEEGNNSLGYDLPTAALPRAATCNTKTIPWSSFKQAGWGKAKISGAEAAAKLVGFRFYINNVDGTEGNINIVSITDYDENATSVCKKFVPKDETSHACANKYCTAAAEHTYKHTASKEATCTNDGYATYTCSGCEKEKTTVYPARHNDYDGDGYCNECGVITNESLIHHNVNAKINYPADCTLDYKTKVTITVTATGVEEGYHLEMVVNGNTYCGTATSVTCDQFELKEDTYCGMWLAKDGTHDGKMIQDGFNITCKAGFFQKLIAFFKGLFGTLPSVEIKP